MESTGITTIQEKKKIAYRVIGVERFRNKKVRNKAIQGLNGTPRSISS